MMKSVFFLAALAAPLIALAEPGNPGLAEAVRRRLGPNLLARAGIPTSSISKECQSSCSSIVSTLDVRTVFFPLTRWSTMFIFWCCRLAMASLHANAHRRTLTLSGTAWNASKHSARNSTGPHLLITMVTVRALAHLPHAHFVLLTFRLLAFIGACEAYGYTLNDLTFAVSPTGIASTGDPFSIFDQATPTPGATKALTEGAVPLLPTAATKSGKIGGAVRLGALQSLNAGIVGAVVAVTIFMGVLPL